jgi:thymidylate synthase ThyX
LVEYAARRCYDSFGKCGLDSHNFVRGIMKKGHLSIAGHGNIVLGLSDVDKNTYHDILESLVTFKEINNYIRWSRDPQSKFDFVLSMNVLTFTDIANKGVDTLLFHLISDAVLKVPSLRWFADSGYQIEGSENPYLNADTDLLKPTVLSSDYIALKEQGLTDYELELHTTITVEIVSDRAMSLQDARHTDMMGRSEISQRYVTMSDFKYRTPVGLTPHDVIYSEAGGLIEVTYGDIMSTIALSYDKIMEYAEANGHNKLRAKELARSVLPNATYSKYIDTRPLRQWKHFFKLRDDVHAQNEKQQDALALLSAFRSVSIPV